MNLFSYLVFVRWLATVTLKNVRHFSLNSNIFIFCGKSKDNYYNWKRHDMTVQYLPAYFLRASTGPQALWPYDELLCAKL